MWWHIVAYFLDNMEIDKDVFFPVVDWTLVNALSNS
jgi:hypothetical protein